MKALTITVADNLYRQASQKAAAADTSLPQVVESFLREWVAPMILTRGAGMRE